MTEDKCFLTWLRLLPAAPEHMLCIQNGRFDHADRMFNRCMFTGDVSSISNVV